MVTKFMAYTRMHLQLLHHDASNKYATIASVLEVRLCLQCRLIQAQMSIHLFSPSMYLSMDPTIVLSTDIQNWHDCNAFLLPNSTAQH
jgi:hypothetical protein